MAKTATYGIETIKFAEPVAGSFPTDWEGFEMKAIVKDSVQYNDSAPSENNVEVEDMDEYYATLKTDKGTRGFTIKTYDMSAEAYNYFYGYTTADGKNTETPGFELGNKALQIVTKALGTEFPSKTFEFANMKLSVTNEGTIGKSGFPNLNITCTKQANLNDDGKEVAGARWYLTETSTDTTSGD